MSYEVFPKYFIEYFFSVQYRVSILNCMIFCIVYNANFAHWEWVFLIGTYIVQVFDMKLWRFMFSWRFLSAALTFIWEAASASMELRMYQVFFCWLIQKSVLKKLNCHYFHLLEKCIYYFFFKELFRLWNCLPIWAVFLFFVLFLALVDDTP